MYQCCLLPPQHSASHPLPLLTPLPSPPVSQACCYGKVIIHKEFQIPPHPLRFGFLIWFFFMLKICFQCNVWVGKAVSAFLKPCAWARERSLCWNWRSSWMEGGMKLWMGAAANGHLIRVMALRSAYMTLEFLTSFLKRLCHLAFRV